MKFFAPRLAHDPRVGAVAGHVAADRLPHGVEDCGGAGEVDAGQVPVGEDRLGHLRPGTRDEVDDAWGQARRLEEPHDVVRAGDGCRRGLPHDGVAHERRGRREVAGDRGEVERREGKDEPFQRAVLDLVPDGRGREGLLGVEILRELGVETPEVDQLAGGVDLGLVDRLGLAQHGRGVDRVPPGCGQKLGRLEEDGGSIFPGPSGPFVPRFGRRLDGLTDVIARGLVPVGQHVAVLVGHDRLGDVAGGDVLSADDEGDFDPLLLHRVDSGLERGLL